MRPSLWGFAVTLTLLRCRVYTHSAVCGQHDLVWWVHSHRHSTLRCWVYPHGTEVLGVLTYCSLVTVTKLVGLTDTLYVEELGVLA